VDAEFEGSHRPSGLIEAFRLSHFFGDMSMETPAQAAAPVPTLRATIRLLQMKGLTPSEAASLTAYMCGLPTTDLHWSLRQINQMLFLQRLYQRGRFAAGDGEPLQLR
jgi:hypothetical protein